MNKQQSGFIMMVMIVIMVVGAAAYFGVFNENLIFKNKVKLTERDIANNLKIREQLLRYATFQPELYESDPTGGTGYALKQINLVPGPGYFPCVDLNGDGEVLAAETSCGNPRDATDDSTGFAIGFLPVGFSTRNIFFGGLEAKQFYYVVDERFVNGNNLYNNGSTGRYAPLNPALTPAAAPDASPGLLLPDNTKPWLSLNGVEGYVALIISPGKPMVMQDGTVQDRTQPGDAVARMGDYLDKRFNASGTELNGNSDGDRFFFSQSKNNIGVNDTIVGITFEEWQSAMLKRVCFQRSDLEALDVNDPVWFNAYDSANNPAGSDWRSYMGNCP